MRYPSLFLYPLSFSLRFREYYNDKNKDRNRLLFVSFPSYKSQGSHEYINYVDE